MLKKQMSYLKIAALALVVLFNSCKKPAGPGGSASIKGQVWAENWNTAFTLKNSEYAAADEDVYIVYGDEVGYSDKTKTDYNGYFEFKYLRKGKYKVYVYSKDRTLQSPSKEVAVVNELEITGKKQNADLGQIVIYK